MPWTVKKSGGKFNVVKGSTGKVVASHSDRSSALSQVRALYANYQGKRPRASSTTNPYSDAIRRRLANANRPKGGPRV